jgi:hypothetical protein
MLPQIVAFAGVDLFARASRSSASLAARARDALTAPDAGRA